MPLHFLWQIKQIITFENHRHVDHSACFGNRGSQIIFMAFMGPRYMDCYLCAFYRPPEKTMSTMPSPFEREGELTFYPPHDTSYPSKQTRLLHLWDELGIPHDKEKQEFGLVLRIIGFEVNPNAMTVSMDIDARKDLIDIIRVFLL